MDELKQILAVLQSMQKDISELKNGQQKLEARLEKLEDGQQKLEARLEKLEDGQQKLEARLEKLEIRLEKLEDGQNRLERIIKQIPEQFDNLEKYMGEEFDKVSNQYTKQQRVIELLSARSIEHEADFKDLKRILKINNL